MRARSPDRAIERGIESEGGEFSTGGSSGSGPLFNRWKWPTFQPSLTEGLLSAFVRVDLEQLAIADRGDYRPLHIHAKAALRPFPALPEERHHATIRCRDVLIDASLKGVPNLQP